MSISETINDEERQIVIECRRRMVEIASRKNPPAWQKWEQRDLDELRRYGPRYAPSEWFCGEGEQTLPEKYRTRFLRAVRSLEVKELLELTTTSGRLTNVKLSEAGLAVAEELEPSKPAKVKAKKVKSTTTPVIEVEAASTTATEPETAEQQDADTTTGPLPPPEASRQ